MENRSTNQLQAEQDTLVKIEREIKKIIPKLREFENILKVEELQLKSNLLCSTLANPQTQTKVKETTIAAPETSSTTAFDMAKDTSAKVEDEFEVNQQDIMLDMVFKSLEEEEEEDDDEDFLRL